MRHLRNSMHSLLVLTAMMFAVQFSPQASAGTVTLTAAQCTKLNADLTLYINFLHKYFGSGPLVQKAIAVATADVNKLCPQPTTLFECGVLDSTYSSIISIGLDSSGTLVNTPAIVNVACMTKNACNTIVGQKFLIGGTTQSAECANPAALGVVHLSDAQVQTKISQLP